jgi:hypothetical protein
MWDKDINLGKITIRKLKNKISYSDLLGNIIPRYKEDGWKIPDKKIFFYIQDLKTLGVGNFPEWVYFSSDNPGVNFYFSTFTIYDKEDSDEYMHIGTGFIPKNDKKYSCVLYKEN